MFYILFQALPQALSILSPALLGLTVFAPVGTLNTLQIAATEPSKSSSAPSSVLAGHVINGLTGQPIPRALVQSGSDAMLTDHDGHFHLSSLIGSNSTLQITKPGFAITPEQLDGSTISLSAYPDKSMIEVPLYPEAVLTGTVTAPDGMPLANIPITIRRSIFSESGHSVTPVVRTHSNSHGDFRAPVPAGQYLIQSEFTRIPYELQQAALPSSVPPVTSSEFSTLSLHSGEELHVDLSPSLGRLHTVTLAATSTGGGSPLRIVARSASGFVLPVGGRGNRRQGEMSLELPNGTFTLEAAVANASGEEMGQSTVTVADRDLIGVQLHFAQVPPVPIEVIVSTTEESSAGSAATAKTAPSAQQLSLSLQNVQPRLDPDSSSAVLPTMLADRTQVFRAAPGHYRLRATGHSSWYIESATYGATNLLQQEITIGPAAGSAPIRLVVSEQTGSLNGSVVLSNRATACWIYVIAADPSATPISAQRSAADGTFLIAHLPPGSYRAVAFEHKHSANLMDANVLAMFSSHVQSFRILPGQRTSVSLDALPTRDLLR